MLQARIRVAVPKSRNSDLDMRIDRETSLVLAAPEEGKFYLNREQISAEAIQDRIGAAGSIMYRLPFGELSPVTNTVPLQ